MGTNGHQDVRERLVYDDSPVALTRSQWAANARRGLVQRLAGRRYVVRHDARRGLHVIAPVKLVD
jgi:hypothetical protein